MDNNDIVSIKFEKFDSKENRFITNINGSEGYLPVEEATIYDYSEEDNVLPLYVISGFLTKECKVEIMSMNPLTFSRKKIMENSYKACMRIYALGDTCTARVIKMVPDGVAFCELENGVEAIIHISNLSATHVQYMTDILNEGDEFICKIMDIADDRKYVISRKDAYSQKEFKPGDIVVGQIGMPSIDGNRTYVALTPSQTGRFKGNAPYMSYGVFIVREAPEGYTGKSILLQYLAPTKNCNKICF